MAREGCPGCVKTVLYEEKIEKFLYEEKNEGLFIYSMNA
jgi:hypothetical protein